MKVLIVLDSYLPDLNGGAYFTHRLAQGLKKIGLDVLVFCPSLNRKNVSDSLDGVRLIRFSSFSTPLYPSFRIINPFLLKNRTLKAIKKFKPDLIHLQGKFILGNASFKCGQKLNIPMIGTNHLTPQNFESLFRIPLFLRKAYNKFVWKWAFNMLHKMQYVTTPTKSGATLMIDNGFQKPIVPISCGIDLYRFQPSTNKKALKAIFNLPDAPIVLFTGRLDQDKKIDVILRAVEQAIQYQHFHFVITGVGAYEKKLKNMVQQLGLSKHVTFVGKIEDAIFPDIYKLADVFVNACEVELQCISALEALASGLPLILADALALHELIDQQHINGFLFPPGDHNKLSEYIVEILSNKALREQMGSNSLQYAQKHNIENTISAYVHLYKKTLHEQLS